MKKRVMSFILAVLTLVLVFASTCVSAFAASGYTSISLGVTAHSQNDIRTFLKNHPTSASVSYSTSASTSGTISAGTLSTTTQNAAVNALNNIRYIAGLNADVTLNSSYSTSASSASLVNALNGSISHTPSRPSQLSDSKYDSLYTQGYTGSSSSNLAGYKNSAPTLSSVILNDWLGDSDSANITTLRHRRWLLSNNMTETGFGVTSYNTGKYTENAYGMYVTSNGKNNTAAPVAWPAQNTPTSYFDASDAWNVCFNYTLDASKVTVKVVRASDSKTWNFSSKSADGTFYVDNGNYGRLKGCVIFQPTGITAKSGDKYTVTVTDNANKKVLTYTVNFFDGTYVNAPKQTSAKKTSSGVKTTWNSVSSAKTYQVYRKVNSGSYTKIATTSSLNYTDKNTKSGNKYSYAVKAVNSNNVSSAYSNVLSVQK